MSSEMKVGSKVIVMVGCREIEATVLEVTETGCRVKSKASGKEFNTNRIARIIEQAESLEAADTSTEVEESAPMPDPVEEASKLEDEAETPNPAPESGKSENPVKKLSLMDAAVEVLKASEQPLNTREIVKAATDAGLWIPTACKTPEQTLYGSIFREIATKENPRIRKSEKKGKFEFAG